MGEASSEDGMTKTTTTEGSTATTLNGFSPVSASPRVFWHSRRRRPKQRDETMVEALENQPRDETMAETTNQEKTPDNEKVQDSTPPATVLSDRRKALFEPLEPIDNLSRKRPSNESLLPPPDFDSTEYPKGWLIGKKRKLVNVDVVEKMRRIAVQEMNRKDREIDGLSEQLDEDARVLEHLQVQLLEEKRKRADVERENAMLQDQINMLMNMLQDNAAPEDDGPEEP